ncbi:hypothetical protein SNE40_001911 [Patella caerulea]|uniref:Transmembrane protein n=1 Tax=Patella caerulea TaxID=87958 RepID=A0AAN8JXF8_PATCE
MEGLFVVILGSFFVLQALWWMIHLTFNYQQNQHHQQSYTVAMLATQYKICKIISIEGLFKFTFGFAIAIVSFMMTSKSSFLQNKELGTVFLCLSACGIQELFAGYYKKPVYEGLDCLITVFLLSVLSLFFLSYSTVIEFPQSTIYSLAFLTSFSLSLCLMLERKFCKEIVFGMMRNYMVLLLGSWMIESNFLINELDVTLDLNEVSLKIAIYFSWHCALDFIIITCVWNIVYKLSTKNYCHCLSAGNADQSFDVLYLENRVHFDMNILGRLEDLSNNDF